jgi:RNA polymerase subunit RPABC4/transcription elongation factor Spt4
MFGVSWSDYEGTVRLAVYALLFYLFVLWLTIGFWTYRDIRQRSRDPFVQSAAVLLVLVFFLPGHWLYLILRPRYTLVELYERSLEEEALLQDLEDQRSCPTCKRRVQEDFLMCPSCKTSLKEPCRSCQKPLSYAWLACPYCGLEKPPREHMGARPVRAPIRPAEAPAPMRASAAPPAQPPAEFVRRAPAPAPTPVRPARDPFARGRTADEGAGPIIGE